MGELKKVVEFKQFWPKIPIFDAPPDPIPITSSDLLLDRYFRYPSNGLVYRGLVDADLTSVLEPDFRIKYPGKRGPSPTKKNIFLRNQVKNTYLWKKLKKRRITF